MGKKKKHKEESEEKDIPVDPELLKMYMTGAANPRHSNEFEAGEDVIDLHLEKISSGKTAIPSDEALYVQLETFEKAMDRAIASGKFEMRVVHGLGKGTLRQAIHKLLDKHPQVSSYKNDYHSRYGFGSTIIYFKP